MTPRIAAALVVASVAVGVQAEYFAIHTHWSAESPLLDIAVGWVYTGAGLIAWFASNRRAQSLIPAATIFVALMLRETIVVARSSRCWADTSARGSPERSTERSRRISRP